MVLDLLEYVCWRFVKYLSVRMEENSLIDSRRCSSEPFLITIGNNVQITNRVAFHTHGVEIVSVNYVLFLMFFLFGPNKPEDIAGAITKMLCLTHEERQEMGKRNRQLCLDRNTEDAFLKSYVDLIEKL